MSTATKHIDRAESSNSKYSQILPFPYQKMSKEKTTQTTKHAFPFPIGQHQATDFLLLRTLAQQIITAKQKKQEWKLKH